MRNPIGEDLGGVQESGRTHLARPQPAVGGGSRCAQSAGPGVEYLQITFEVTFTLGQPV